MGESLFVESGIRDSTNDLSSTDNDWNPESMVWNAESKTVLGSFTCCVFFCVCDKSQSKITNEQFKITHVHCLWLLLKCSRICMGLMHQSNPTAPSPLPPPGPLRDICLPCQSREWVIRKLYVVRGSGICLLRGHP